MICGNQPPEQKPAAVVADSKIDFMALRRRSKESKRRKTDLEILKAAIREKETSDSRSSAGERTMKRRHHPLRYSANEASRIRSTVKMRQKAATDLSQCAAL